MGVVTFIVNIKKFSVHECLYQLLYIVHAFMHRRRKQGGGPLPPQAAGSVGIVPTTRAI